MDKKEQQSQDQQQEQGHPPVGTELENSEFTKSPHTSDQEERDE